MVSSNKKSSVRTKSLLVLLCLNFLVLILPVKVSAQTDANSPVRRKAIEKIQLVSFNLANGRRISGRLLNEDAYIIEISEIKGSTIIPVTYYKDDIDKKSVIYKYVSELDYWRDTGDYFLQKVWDFHDDPDEFIQAIRCFENAETIAENALGPEHRLVAELNDKITQIKADMEKWSQQMQSRQELRKLELLSTFDTRLQRIESQIAANSKDIDDLNKTIADKTTTEDYKDLNNKINNVEVTARYLEQRMQKIENDMSDSWRYNRYYYPRYYIIPGPARAQAR